MWLGGADATNERASFRLAKRKVQAYDLQNVDIEVSLTVGSRISGDAAGRGGDGRSANGEDVVGETAFSRAFLRVARSSEHRCACGARSFDILRRAPAAGGD